MRKFIVIVLAVVGVISFVGCTNSHNGEPLRVACVGNSITFGYGIENRVENSYPAQLGKMLGAQWKVRNFGVNGATMLKNGDKPYWNQQEFQDVMTYEPDIVLIKLGTNDTKPGNWRYKDEFVTDYKEMVAQFANLRTKPKIFVCYPVPIYIEGWISVKEEVIPLIQQVVEEKQVQDIDLYSALDGKPELLPDGVHPNKKGARIMAETIYQVLT